MGDLSEGLAGSPQKAIQMANNAFKAVNKMNLKVPFIMTKGNHDITGPGAKEAFEKVYLPNMARLAGHPSLQSANYLLFLMMYYLCVMIHGIGIGRATPIRKSH